MPYHPRKKLPQTPPPHKRFDETADTAVDAVPVARAQAGAFQSSRAAVYRAADGRIHWRVVAPTDPRSLRPLNAGRPIALLTPFPLVPPNGVHPELN